MPPPATRPWSRWDGEQNIKYQLPSPVGLLCAGHFSTRSNFILPTVRGGCREFLLSRMRKTVPRKVQEGTPRGLRCSLPSQTLVLQGPLPGRPAGCGGRGLGRSHTHPRGSPGPGPPHTHSPRRGLAAGINLKQYGGRQPTPTRASRRLAFEGREHRELSLAFLLICYSIKTEKKKLERISK